MNGNNDNGKRNSSNEMSLSSLLRQAHRDGYSSDPHQPTISTTIDCSQNRCNRLDVLHDVIEKALRVSLDSSSLASSDTPAPRRPPRRRRSHKKKRSSSADSYLGYRTDQ
jgi:hypothetical protein